jgi:FKBP-type peptidyl-prolyl cis-trans isomerase
VSHFSTTPPTIPKIISKNSPDGKEPETIEPQDAVLVNIEGWMADSKEDNEDNKETKVFQRSKSWLVVVGDGDVLPAIEMGIRFMETGQTALVWSHSKYAMGPGTRSIEGVVVPPYTNVMYKIQLLQKVMDTSRLNPYFTIQKALTKKKIANDVYQFEWCPPPASKDDPTCEQAMARAIRLYTKAAKEMETLLQGNYFANVEEDHPQRTESQQLLLDALNNIVAVYLKQKEYHKAKLAAVNVLQVDPHNLKALLRAAKASLLDPASTLEEAKAALKAAEDDITYKNPDEEQQLQRLKALFKKKQHEYKTSTKNMFGNKLQQSKTESGKGDKDKEVDSGDKSIGKGDDAKETTPAAPAKTHRDKSSKDGTAEKTADTDNTDDAATTKTTGEDAANQHVDFVEKDDFWRTQAMTAFVQIAIPMLLYLLYRYFHQKEGASSFDWGLWKSTAQQDK